MKIFKHITLLRVFIFYLAFFFVPQVYATNDTITQEEFEQLADLPDEYQALSYSDRIDWLNAQLTQDISELRKYQLSRELASQYSSHHKYEKAQDICQTTRPFSFDASYRYICIETKHLEYEESIRQFLALYQDAMEIGDKNIAGQALAAIGWKQSEAGDIASAFQTYEQGLLMGDELNFNTLNNLMLNTATLYIIHGDQDYIKRGIELHKDTLQRFKRRIQEEQDNAKYFEHVIDITQINLGIAHTLHFPDYEEALYWFEKVDKNNQVVSKSALVFSALAAAELGRNELAQAYLNQSYKQAASEQVNTDYLSCYQQLVQVKLGQSNSLNQCNNLNKITPLEVELDIYKRLAKLEDPVLRLSGLENMFTLFTEKLENQLRHSSTSAASGAELNRLEQESRLKSELIEKEQALKISEKAKSDGQIRLAIAVTLILLMAILIIAIRLNQKRKLAQQFEAMSLLDVLTGLNNRRFFELNIRRELNFAKRAQKNGPQQTIAFYLIDIDYFKKVNDTYGHEVGDNVLVEFAQRIKQAIRETDLFVRWGGEEFLLVERLEQTEDYKLIANRISNVISQKAFAVSATLNLDITCTIGSIVYPYALNQASDIHWNKLVQLADAALYYGKRKHRNCWVCIERVASNENLEKILNQELEISLEQGLVSVTSSFQSVDHPKQLESGP